MNLKKTAMDKKTWRTLKADCEVVEEGTFGVKVLRCINGDYIKVFRIKHQVSMSRLFNPALQFCRNAATLKQLGVDSITPVSLYFLTHKNSWAVRYRPLEGETLRSLINRNALPEKTVADLGAYIAQLHNKGIYFRSLHPGNIVLQPDGQFGLIDVLDCGFRWFGLPLNNWQRRRNLRHFFRYDDGKLIEAVVLAGYRG